MTATRTVTSVHDLSLTTTRTTTAGLTPLVVRRADALVPRPQRVLLADDDVTSLTGSAGALSAPQRELHSTLSGDLALELALQLHFDLVVLHLTGTGAVEVTRGIRACRDLQQPTVVVVDGSGDAAARSAARRAGADRVLSGPAGADLAQALSDLLE
jgi:CheY-like chemotaxis protein